MTLQSAMELYSRYQPAAAPAGIVIRTPVFLPQSHAAPHQHHHYLQARIPLPLALMSQLPRRNSMAQSPEKATSSFSIADILNGTIGRKATGNAQNKRHHAQPEVGDNQKVIRPWDDCGSRSSRSSRSSSPIDTSTADDEEIDVGDEKPKQQGKNKNSPLDALFKMTSKTFEGLDASGLLGPGIYRT